MDSDDWIDPDTLERCYDKCREHSLDFAFFDAVSFSDSDEDTFWVEYRRAAFYPGIMKGTDAMLSMLRDRRYRCTVCMSLFSRKFLDRIGASFRSGIIHEDELFSALVYFNAQRIEAVDAAFYHRRIRGNSTMTGGFSKRNVDGYLTVLKESRAYAKGNNDAKKARRHLSTAIFEALMLSGWCLPASQKIRILGAMLMHPYAFRPRAFAVFLLKRSL